MSVADDLRQKAEQFRSVAESCSRAHVEAASSLAKKLSPAERIGAEAEASVSDCMARRYRQWATHLEAAAAEADEAS